MTKENLTNAIKLALDTYEQKIHYSIDGEVITVELPPNKHLDSKGNVYIRGAGGKTSRHITSINDMAGWFIANGIKIDLYKYLTKQKEVQEASPQEESEEVKSKQKRTKKEA